MSYVITNDNHKPALTDEAELAHYGVKGMKWGVRRDQATLDRAAGRTSGKTTNAVKKSAKAQADFYKPAVKKTQDAAKKLKKASDRRDSKIKKARDDLPTKKAELKTAKKKYKGDKKEIGRKAAKEILKPIKDDYLSTLQTAMQKQAAEIAIGLVLDQVRNHTLREISRRETQTDFNIRRIEADQARRRAQQTAEIERNRRHARDARNP